MIRITRWLRWIKARPKRCIAGAMVGALLLLNVWAYLHAYAMTHFVESGRATAAPESLSTLQKAKVLLAGVRVPKPANDRSPADLGLAFEVHYFDAGDGNRLEAWYIPHSAPKRLCILFHSYGQSKSSLLVEAAEFHALGYATLLVDFRASGVP